ncbi:MAG: acyl-CoA dehydrogenase family protein [Alphaproteobacteria bacterium]|nr:acyl-CoA dehydrogenase family protein [Alphaproteobacteria bacterium]
MDFDYSEDQKLLQESMQRFVRENYSFEARRALVATEQGYSDAHWTRFAELGWLGIPFPEEYGGLGMSGVETMVVMEAIGSGLVAEPYLSTVILGGGAVSAAGSDAQKDEILPAIAEGRCKLAFAFAERQARYNLQDVEMRAVAENGNYRLSGTKSVVFGAPTADRFVVSARTGGGSRDAAGITLFLVAADAPGLSVRSYPTADGLRAGEVMLDNTPAEGVLGEVDSALTTIEEVVDRAIAAVAAEAVGLMGALNDMTLEYLKTREQFGQPIGRFQVLQHRMVDMFIAHEEAKSMAMMAAMRIDEDDPGVRKKAMSATKVQIGKSARFIGQQSIQLHGGIGMTDEYAAGHYFKRLTMIDRSFGDSDYHLRRYAAL